MTIINCYDSFQKHWYQETWLQHSSRTLSHKVTDYKSQIAGHTASLTMLSFFLLFWHASISWVRVKMFLPFDIICKKSYSWEIQFEMKRAVHIKNTRGATGPAFKVREGHLIPFEKVYLLTSSSFPGFFVLFSLRKWAPPKQVTVFSELLLNKVLGKKEGVQGAVVLVFTRSRFLESVCVTQCVYTCLWCNAQWHACSAAEGLGG